MFTDRGNFGFDEPILRVLVTLVESAHPEHQRNLHNTVVGYFLTSGSAVARIGAMITQIEHLRQIDSRFENVGIGLGEGEMIAEFAWLGHYKRSELMPLGQAAMDASRCADGAKDAYRKTLEALQTELGPSA